MRKHLTFAGSSLLLAFACLQLAFAADAPSFAGEFADRKYLSGQAVFQMSIEQHGNTASIWFSAGYSDGHGSAPEADGTGKVNGKGLLEFSFKDSEGNAGNGTITRSGDGIIVSLKPTHVSDSRSLVFYRENIHLKRGPKK
jgi:hypothetical protein